jgi:DNA-binding GntR family transcriptional regulator
MATVRTARVEAAYLDIRQRIVSGAYPPGTPLSESELTRVVAASRTPIREALSQLLEEGYVERIPGRGYYVARITVKSIQDTFEVRRLLEGQAAAHAAKRHDPSMLRRLRELAPVPAVSDEEGRRSAREANTRFHLAVAEAGGNSLLVELIQNCLNQVDRYLAHGIRLRTVQSRITEEHLEIVAAVERGDEHEACSAMERHLDDCSRQFMQALMRGERQDIAV